MFNRDDFKTFNYQNLNGKTLKIIVTNNVDGLLLAGQDVETNEIYILDLKPNREENQNNSTSNWRKEYIKDIQDNIKKYYDKFDINGLINIKDRLENNHGKELGQIMFESIITGINLEKSIIEAKKEGNK